MKLKRSILDAMVNKYIFIGYNKRKNIKNIWIYKYRGVMFEKGFFLIILVSFENINHNSKNDMFNVVKFPLLSSPSMDFG